MPMNEHMRILGGIIYLLTGVEWRQLNLYAVSGSLARVIQAPRINVVTCCYTLGENSSRPSHEPAFKLRVIT
jgi:hypothetical protein